jgi:hypothetical protein
MNNQTFHIHWRLAEDYPSADGEYLVCSLLRDGSYGNTDFMEFTKGEWVVEEGQDYPSYWVHVPLPVS